MKKQAKGIKKSKAKEGCFFNTPTTVGLLGGWLVGFFFFFLLSFCAT